MNKSKIEPLYKDYNWLKETYEKYNSVYKIAHLLNCSPTTIHYWLIKFNIRRTGRNNYKHSEETKLKISICSLCKKPMLGKKHKDLTKQKMSQTRKGSKNANWKGGITKKIRKFRHTKEYYHWRNAVIIAANGICQLCGKELPLEAHHKISLHKDFSLALDKNNGIALCHDCHIEVERRTKNEQAG